MIEMGVLYSVYNHTRREYVGQPCLNVNGKEPVAPPYGNFIAWLMAYKWRYDEVQVLTDEVDFDTVYNLEKVYKDVSIEMYDEFIDLFNEEFEDWVKEIQDII
jgi:hypothetical protein